MSTRERWIIYPLLFLTLGIAMRNQFLPTKRMGAVDLMAGELTAQTIHCNNLEVKQDQSCANLTFGTAQGNRLEAGLVHSQIARSAQAESFELKIIDKKENPIIILLEDPKTKSGTILTLRDNGSPQVQILSNDAGGLVTAFGHTGQVAMGHEGQVFGVFGQFSQVGQPPFPLTPLTPFQSQLSPPKIPSTPQNTPPEEKKEELKKEETKPEDKK
jgi:hypothetical protein